MYYVYILISLKDNKRYIGSTNNIVKRFHQHLRGKVFSTRHRRPFELIYSESFPEEKLARERERYFKTHKGYNELKRLLGPHD